MAPTMPATRLSDCSTNCNCLLLVLCHSYLDDDPLDVPTPPGQLISFLNRILSFQGQSQNHRRSGGLR